MMSFSQINHTFAEGCEFGNGDIRSEFKKCNPSIGVKPEADINLNITKSDSDFREIVATIVRRVQVITSVVAIGIIVWIGLILVLPTNAEVKESAKGKVISVVLGFLFMISATIIVNGIINFLYEIFK
jgi:hypothetical protein